VSAGRGGKIVAKGGARADSKRMQGMRECVTRSGIRRAKGLWLLAGVLLLGSGGVLGAAYEEPDFTKRIFNPDAISLEGEAREDVVTALAGLAAQLSAEDGGDVDLIEKALAIALRLDSMHPVARAANDALLGGGKVTPVEEISSPVKAATILWEAASDLDSGPSEPEDARLVPYLMDIVISVDAGEGEARQEVLRKALEREGAELEWRRFVTLPPEPKVKVEEDGPPPEVATAMPGDPVSPGPGLEMAGAGDAGPGGEPVLPEPSPEVRPDPAVLAPGPMVAFRIPEGRTRVVLYPEDGQGMVNPKFWQVKLMMAADLGAEAHVVDAAAVLPAEGAGQAAFRRVYSRVGIFGGAAGPLAVMLNQLAGKHGRISADTRVELKLAKPVTGEDLPVEVAALAAPTYVLLDAMVAGAELDGGFAIAGTVDAEGRFLGSMRVLEILEAAAEAGATAMVIPREAKEYLRDAAIGGDLSILFRMQVFGIDSIDEAGRYMMQDREASVNEAMGLFNEIRALLGGTWTMETLARNPAVQERLERVVALCPDHLSAETLLAYGREQLPDKYSLAGSLRAIEKAASAPLAALESASGGVVMAGTESLGRNAIFDLRNERPKLHPAAMKYADAVGAVLDIAEVLLVTKNRDTTMALQKIAEMAKAGGEMVVVREGLIEAIILADDG
jgi:hypothetical protein